MGEITYSLSYLPKFFNDLEEHVGYISDVLHNKTAANDLMDSIEAAILERLPIAESFEPFHSIKERLYPYYRIYVKNYTIYYVVIPDATDNKKIMEVRRILHNLQNRDNYI
ncbi:plasmid stabilization protein [Oribacterium sp. C9]|uniref:type II toxin-antitoxin system RelE/ParE family toxin n=1 Tax=Oribacterium sp. C9 TaxID=1943579 RepID=UPI00098F1AD4|nr:type II toxin-antitoxin system RelE/ParE family toxin [Oribacterium sp. C9]OON85535.1 plasmid stabilization protein [Oribacterium sp. C9]